jgi:hypothetical protein
MPQGLLPEQRRQIPLVHATTLKTSQACSLSRSATCLWKQEAVDAINDRSIGHRAHELPDPSFPGTA